MNATRIEKATKTTLHARPVFIQGIMQQTLRELTGELDARVNGVLLRLPIGCVIAVLGGGSGGTVGKLCTTVEFVAENGEVYRSSEGMDLLIPAPC